MKIKPSNWKDKLRACFVAHGRHDKDGYEIGNPVPKELPLGFKRPLTLQEQIARALRSQEVQLAQRARGEETFEDSMNFGPEDPDPVPVSVHQRQFVAEEVVKAGAVEHTREERRKAKAASKPADPPKEDPKT